MRLPWFSTLTAVIVAGTLAPAAPARADDGRAVSPTGELRSFYRHALNRTPDASGLNTYLGLAGQDCRAGVLRFSYRVTGQCSGLQPGGEGPCGRAARPERALNRAVLLLDVLA
ncbi:hypothetical protein [Actinoplanes palleronii]|uniref:DUF4214 domain-containing protein n=1 Tax=Actinoplanes palleronii TaxID=113570 RepID=A0ABQ4BP95_9ACTN|nr:hypothetical protein [Actinoplanes palleronii]GIE72503.1 hypothetical protein Apa02nite_086110 [Actinoplanes palleronii]